MKLPDIDPVFVVDVHDLWPNRKLLMTACRDWLLNNTTVDPNHTWRVEFYLFDAPFIVVYQHDWDDEGKWIIDREKEEIVQREPFTVLVDDLPKEELFVFTQSSELG